MPQEPAFADLEIKIFERRDDGYPVEITCAKEELPRGVLSADILPWEPAASPEEDGERLFDALFRDRKLGMAWARAVGQNPRRRIRLNVHENAPELHTLPWELMRDTTMGAVAKTIAADQDTPFSRYLRVPVPRRGLVTARPIKMLVAIANPKDLETEHGLPALDTETEMRIIQESLGEIQEHQVAVTTLSPPVTLAALNAKLLEGYHILHFVGHGRYIEREEQAFLYLADEDNRATPVRDIHLAEMLAFHGDSLRLVFLASCQTAERSPRDAFGGLAPKILAAGVPAVLAMQDRVPVEMARKLTRTFYQQLLIHGYVDSAVNEARSMVITHRVPGSWGIATLFSRLPENQIVRFVDMSAEQVQQYSEIAAVPRDVTPGAVEKIAANQSQGKTRAMLTSADQMLAMFEESESPEDIIEQIEAGDAKLTRTDVLLSKATLLETEAEQTFKDHIETHLPRIFDQVQTGQSQDRYSDWQTPMPPRDTPFKAKLRAASEQAIQDMISQTVGSVVSQVEPGGLQQMSAQIVERLLAGFDVAAYQARLEESYALVIEAKEREPENVEILLREAKLVIALHPDDPSQGQGLLNRLAHRLEQPANNVEKEQLARLLYLQGDAQRPPNLELLRQAHAVFVDSGNEDAAKEVGQQIAYQLTQQARGRRTEAEYSLGQHAQLKMQQFAQGRFDWQSLAATPPPTSYKARLMVKLRDVLRLSLPPNLWAGQPGMNPAQQEAAFSAMVHRILADYDDAGFQAKMNEAYARVAVAEQFAPEDMTILLEKANLLVWLTPDDDSDERALLQHVRQRLQNPKSDAERNTLAMTLLLLATMRGQPDRALLQEARNLFASLGFQSQVAHCDALLSPPFNPVGQWQIRIGDAAGSMMHVWLQPDGTCTGNQQAGVWGGLVSFAGHWGYDPNSKMLQMQVLINGFQPFALGITIAGEQAGGYAGRGTDGFSYFMMRVR